MQEEIIVLEPQEPIIVFRTGTVRKFTEEFFILSLQLSAKNFKCLLFFLYGEERRAFHEQPIINRQKI